MKRLIFFLVATFITLNSALALEPALKESKEEVVKPKILAATTHLYSFAAGIASEFADIELLLPPEASPFSFKLTDLELRKIMTADVIVKNGLGLETWLDDTVLKTAAKKDVLVINASEGIEALKDASGAPDPQVWLDPVLAIKQVDNIRAALMKKFPQHEEPMTRRGDYFLGRLKVVDDNFEYGLGRLPDAKRLIVGRNGWAYFAKRYGLEIVGVLKDSNTAPLGPQQLTRMRELVEKHGVKAVFTDPGDSTDAVKGLAQGLKISLAVLDPVESGGPLEEHYEDVMRENLKTLFTVFPATPVKKQSPAEYGDDDEEE